MTIKLAVSIVIATLGDKKLIKLIGCLNKNKNYKISEIIISIPRNKFNYIKDLTQTWDNIKIVTSEKKVRYCRGLKVLS